MKSLLKILLPTSLIVLLILIANIFMFPGTKSISSPLNQDNINQKIYNDFTKATHISGINQDVSQIDYKPHLQEIHFLLNQNSHTTSVIISTKKDIYSQVAILQKAIKVAKIKGNQISFIDLGQNHPYAKLKNN
jgi:hypothetical protein